MLHRRYHIDFGSRNAEYGGPGSDRLGDAQSLRKTFYLDYLHLIGMPGRILTRPDTNLLSSTTITFHHWSSDYQVDLHGILPHSLQGRCFRLAQDQRFVWYIVMHGGESLVDTDRTCLSHPRACVLAHHIISLFETDDELIGCGISRSWKLSGTESVVITTAQWARFQQIFHQTWRTQFLSRAEIEQDPWWLDLQPTFHLYDLGGNIELKHNDFIADMASRDGPELPPEGVHRHAMLNPFRSSSPALARDPPIDDRSSIGAEETASSSTIPSVRHRLRDHSALAGLDRELQRQFHMDSISWILYDIAVNLQPPEEDRKALLVDLHEMKSMMGYRKQQLTPYPQAMNARWGNCQASQAPSFLQIHAVDPADEHLQRLTQASHVLKATKFQAYNLQKRLIRFQKEDLTVTKGLATAVICLPQTMPLPRKTINRRTRALHRLLGMKQVQRSEIPWQELRQPAPSQHPPEGVAPVDHQQRAFRREERELKRARESNQCGLRMEQRFAIALHKFPDDALRLETAFLPMLYFMKVFRELTDSWKQLVRELPHEVSVHWLLFPPTGTDPTG